MRLLLLLTTTMLGFISCSKALYGENVYGSYLAPGDYYPENNGQPVHCTFLHGFGVESGSIFADLYWNSVKNRQGPCTNISIPIFDTANRDFADPGLIRETYNAAIAHTGPNSVVFAHSQANLALVLACHLFNLCAVKWNALAPPWQGASGAKLAHKYCQQEDGGLDGTTAINEQNTFLFRFMASLVPDSTVCVPAIYPLAPRGYISSKMPTEDIVKKIVQRNVLGTMCGTHAIGLKPIMNVALEIVHLGIQETEGNSTHTVSCDGLVDVSSCEAYAPENAFTDKPWNQYYQASLNHADLGLMFGDGLWGVSRQPYTWFVNAIMSRNVWRSQIEDDVPVNTAP